MKKLLIAVVVCCTALVSHAEFVDGNDLLSWMAGDEAHQMVAIGYVSGVVDALHGAAICPPPASTIGEMLEVTKAALESSPSTRHFSADSLIAVAVGTAYPCHKKGVAI